MIPVSDSATFKFNSINLQYKEGDFINSSEVFNRYGKYYFFVKGGKVIKIYEDPEKPVQEPKMCVQIKSL